MNVAKRYGFFIVFAVLPFIIPDSYFVSVLVTALIFAILAKSLNIVVGFVGEISFGHAAFFGLGAYTSALITQRVFDSFWLGLLCVLIVTGIAGAVIAMLALRLKGPYFAIVTLAFAEILRLIVLNWQSFTGGASGLHGIERPVLFGLEIGSVYAYYYFVLVFLILIFYFIDRLLKSKIGIAFIAIREKDDLAKSIGIDPYWYKVMAFSISAVIAGMSGGLYAHYFQTVSADNLGVYYTTIALIMVMVGGRGTYWGPIIGAVIFTLLPEYLRVAGEWRMVIFSLILVICCLFMPLGITSLSRKGALIPSLLRKKNEAYEKGS